jgi:hypothetical protein
VQKIVSDLADRFPDVQLSVIDIGSGPLSLLLWGQDAGLFQPTCIDALGNEYNRLLNEYEIDSDVSIQVGHGETMNYQGHFHMAYSRNALDHCESPSTVFSNMRKAIVKKGFLVISTARNEGSNMNWTGPHQYNLDIEDDHLTLTDRSGKRDLLGVEDDLRCVWSEISAASDFHDGYIDIVFEKV